MATATDSEILTLPELREIIRSVEPAAILVEPRILRRVIKQDRKLAGLALFVPHRKAYVIQRERLLVIASRSELNVSNETELPNKLILLAEPSDDESLELLPRSEALYIYWRLLFHARVHLSVEQLTAHGQLGPEAIFERLRTIGLTEFEEIRSVLHRDAMLLAPDDDAETYAEFLAEYLEYRSFSESDLPLYFPAIRDWDSIDRMARRDVDADAIYEATRLPGAPPVIDRLREQQPDSARIESEPERSNLLQPSPPQYWKLQARAERVSAVGNVVKAAIYRTRAARRALPDRAAESKAAAQAELTRLAERLQSVLQSQHLEATKWVEALEPMLNPASRGLWSNEARFLYDLQKVCIEHERGVYSIDLINYCLSRGAQPLRRPLPLLREVLITKHLRTASRRLATARISAAARERVSELMEEAVERIEQQLRSRIRPLIASTLDDVGLFASNVPERVARRKLVEELLDSIVDHGFITMGQLRDAISKNNLKLPDISGAAELLRGDQLLRADRLLAKRLDGVYRPGAIYLRVPQLLSSLAFGTSNGRIVTSFLILPYGGAFLILEFAKYLLHSLGGAVSVIRDPDADEPAEAVRQISTGEADPASATTTAAGGDTGRSAGETGENDSNGETAPESPPTVHSPEPSNGPENRQPEADSPKAAEGGADTATSVAPADPSGAADKPDPVADKADKPVAVAEKQSETVAAGQEIASTQSDGVSAKSESAVTQEASDPESTTISPSDAVANPTSDSGTPASNESETTRSIARQPVAPAIRASTWQETLEFYGLVLLVGTFLLALIHRPRFRSVCGECVWHLWRVIRFLVYEIPAGILQSKWMQWVLQSPLYTILRNYVVRPTVFTAFALLALRVWQVRLDPDSTLNVFLGINLFLNSSIGRYADEWLTDVLVRAWHDLRMRLFAAAIQFVADWSHRVMEYLERVLYAVDEWLRFRAGDSRISIAYKAVMSVVWAVMTYCIRIYATLLIEPQVNPIKHFPVVTVSHKIMLPYSLVLTRIVATPLEPFLGKILANAIAAVTVFLMPGLFGFLVWELKENWRLYAANRSRVLKPSIIGRHGESLPRLLRPGFHSGTAPKLFARLRRSLRKAQRSGDWKAVNSCRALRREVERQLQRFGDREFCVLLEECGFHGHGMLQCSAARIATNRIEIEFRRAGEIPGSLHVIFEDHSPWLIASVRTAGWEQSFDAVEQRRYLTALMGLLKLAAVDLIDERIRLDIDRPYQWYQCGPTGIVVIAGPTPEERHVVPLVSESGVPYRDQDPVIDTTEVGLEKLPLVFGQASILWDDWIGTWKRLSEPGERETTALSPSA